MNPETICSKCGYVLGVHAGKDESCPCTVSIICGEIRVISFSHHDKFEPGNHIKGRDQLRKCEFRRMLTPREREDWQKVHPMKNVPIKTAPQPGYFHCFGLQIADNGEQAASYSVAIVESEDGHVYEVDTVGDIKFI